MAIVIGITFAKAIVVLAHRYCYRCRYYCLSHCYCHILDLIITNISSKLDFHSFCIDTCISDHKTVCVDLNLAKPHNEKKLFLIVVLIISIALNLINIFLSPLPILNTSI